MKGQIRSLTVAALLLIALPAYAAVEGAVSNGTTQKPQAGVKVTVLKLEGGMVPVGEAVTGADGRFRVDAPAPSGQLPYLVRGDYKGVGYFSPARPGVAEIALQVFDTTSEAAAFRLSTHQLIFEPHQSQILVLEAYTINNDSKPPKTYSTKESFHFNLPGDDVQELSVSATGPGGLPLRQNTVAKGKGRYALDYAFRPGETRVEVSYKLPYQDGFTFREPATAGLSEAEVIAPIEGVTVKGDHLTLVNKDEAKRAAFYAWKGIGPLEMAISGALPDAPAAGAEGNGMPGTGEEVTTVERPTFVSQSRWPVLIVLVMALGAGLLHLDRMDLAGLPKKKTTARQPAGALRK